MTLTATITPETLTGTVQLQDGTTALGAPVSVVNGSATLITSTLTPGAHSLTAVFTPTNPTAYAPSTSPTMSMTVTGPAGGGALPEQLTTPVKQLIQPILGIVLGG